MKKITIVGAGFAALTAAKNLRKLNPESEITLVSPRPEFIYLPSLIWIPSGIRQPEDLVIPLQRFFKRHRITHFAASATGLEDEGRTLLTDAGKISNDGLIIATGGRFIKKLPGIEHCITPCEGIPGVVKIRDRLQEMSGGNIALGFSGNPKEPSAMRGGPMFEFLFGIDEMLRAQGRRDKFNITFFTPAPAPGNRLGPKAVKELLKEINKRDITTHFGHKLKSFSPTGVVTEGGEFDADLIIFMPGMTGNLWFDATELPRSEGGLIRANEMCQVKDMDRVYVAGDSGSFPGPDWMPKQAHMADLQAEAAAANLTAEFAGKAPSKTFKVELICIIDSGTRGTMVSRTLKRNIMLPSMRLFHWSKRFFEWWYLRQYR